MKHSIIGQTVNVTMDRPIGAVHPKHPDIVYPINYGYIEGLMGGDGEEQDVYVLGPAEPLATFTGRVIAVIERADDVEEKWVASDGTRSYTKQEIAEAVRCQEQYHQSTVYME